MQSILSQIISDVIERTGITLEQIRSKSHKPAIVEARHIICYLASMYTHESFVYIGEIVNIDRTAVVSAIFNFNDRLPFCPDLKTKLDSYPVYGAVTLTSSELATIEQELLELLKRHNKLTNEIRLMQRRIKVMWRNQQIKNRVSIKQKRFLAA